MDQDDRRTEASKRPPSGAGGGADAAGKDERTARREHALRANLRRRKAQSRARADADGAGKPPGDPE
ncbi:MAG: hypothetical protein P1U88_21885 [Thalassobaculaceae bacterium]|nr:hypothetical protein [Thalassobaculaceae bacterium]